MPYKNMGMSFQPAMLVYQFLKGIALVGVFLLINISLKLDMGNESLMILIISGTLKLFFCVKYGKAIMIFQTYILRKNPCCHGIKQR